MKKLNLRHGLIGMAVLLSTVLLMSFVIPPIRQTDRISIAITPILADAGPIGIPFPSGQVKNVNTGEIKICPLLGGPVTIQAKAGDEIQVLQLNAVLTSSFVTTEEIADRAKTIEVISGIWQW